MRWLLDQGLSRGAILELECRGHDAIHVGNVQMAASSDSEILAYALMQDRIVVTLDADFHALLAHSGAHHPSVLRIREEGLKGSEVAALIHRIAERFNNADAPAVPLAQCQLTHPATPDSTPRSRSPRGIWLPCPAV